MITGDDHGLAPTQKLVAIQCNDFIWTAGNNVTTPSATSMKFFFLILLVGSMAGQPLPAQTPNVTTSFAGKNKKEVSYAPLSLTINGAGYAWSGYVWSDYGWSDYGWSFHDGQMLQVGCNYLLIAVPNRGYKFAGWNRVNVFTLTSAEIDENTSPPTTNYVTSIDLAPEPTLNKNPFLKFKMDSPEILYNANGNSLTESIGWQANFVPIVRKVRVATQSVTSHGQ